MIKDQLYFDGSCPLCAKEIAMLKKYAAIKLDFIDIHSIDFEENEVKPGNNNPHSLPSKDKLLKLLHLRLANGQWLIGLDANIHMWSNTTFGMLLSILRWPIISFVADTIYRFWAKSRYKKRYECGACQITS